MTDEMRMLTAISKNLTAYCLQSQIFEPDEKNNFYTLVAEFESEELSSLIFDCTLIPGPIPEDNKELDLQIFATIQKEFELEYLRDVIWTVTKINHIQPFGHFGVSIEDGLINWKYTAPLNLRNDEQVESMSIVKRLIRARMLIADMALTLLDVSTGKELPSAALKKNKWARYF